MSVTTKSGGNFEELLKSLNDVAEDAGKLGEKAGEPDDKAIAAAAAEAGVNVDGADGDEEEEDGGEGEGKEFGKSLGTDGEGNDLVDATDLVKSLMARQDSTDDTLAKALTAMAGAVGKQNDLLKSLQAEVKSMSTQGRGRKTLLVATEKPGIGETLAKGAVEDEGGITPADLLAKSESAYAAKAISGTEFTTIDVCLRNQWPIDPGILRKVAAASK